MSTKTTYACDGEGCTKSVDVPYPGSLPEEGGWAIVTVFTGGGSVTAHACSTPCIAGMMRRVPVLYEVEQERVRAKSKEKRLRTEEHLRYRKGRL